MTDRTWYLLIVAVFGIILAAVVFGFAVSVAAQTGVDIPLEQIHRGDPGDRFLEAEIGATNEIGWTCGATLIRRNNESTHEGTNLIIVSGANTVMFTNIESESFDEAIRAFVIDGDILVYTQIGEDGVSSMGYLLEFECNPPESSTTTSTSPSSTTSTTPVTSTTVPDASTTTTVPPPINGVDTGGGGCADGACDVSMAATTLSADGSWSLSPLLTWLLIGVVWSLLAGLAWAFVHGATRMSDG